MTSMSSCTRSSSKMTGSRRTASVSIRHQLDRREAGLTAQVVVRLGSWSSMGIRIRQESFPLVGVPLHRLLRRKTVPDSADCHVS